MNNRPNTTSSQAISCVGKDTLRLLFGAEGPAQRADIFAELLRLASAQVHLLAEPWSRNASLARLAALYRLAPGIVDFLPGNVIAQVGLIGRSRPHAFDENANRREAVVHAVLLLELRGGLTRSESSISDNFWKIERIAADFLTEQFRAAGGSDKMRVGPERVTAKTIRVWIRRYEDDPIRGLYNRPRSRSQPVRPDIEVPLYASATAPAQKLPSGHERPSNVVPFQARGRNLTFVPWWLKDFS